jgi:hypothetical protein
MFFGVFSNVQIHSLIAKEVLHGGFKTIMCSCLPSSYTKYLLFWCNKHTSCGKHSSSYYHCLLGICFISFQRYEQLTQDRILSITGTVVYNLKTSWRLNSEIVPKMFIHRSSDATASPIKFYWWYCRVNLLNSYPMVRGLHCTGSEVYK